MLLHALIFVLGLVVLVFGAEALVRGASRLALSMGISPLVVGLTVVAFGTSAPELAVSVNAALVGNADIAIGNVIGSNIANILLVMGISAAIVPLLVHPQILRQELPVMIGASLLFLIMALDGRISQFEGGVLFLLIVLYTIFLVRQSRSGSMERLPDGVDLPEAASRDWDRHWGVQASLVLIGLVGLVAGSQWLVKAAVFFAVTFGISDLVIGLTIVAVGTSLPEIATSIVAALRGERDIAVGNLIGSNLFNILSVIGLTGLVVSGGLVVASMAIRVDLWIMLAVSVLILPVILPRLEVPRWAGIFFLSLYAGYTVYLILLAKDSAFLPAYSTFILGFLFPLTIIALTLRITLIRHPA
jgi:cation:H+ antiporter